MKGTRGSSKRSRPRGTGVARQRARTTSRDRTIDATLAALAHDIRTPLSGILAMSELLLTSGLPEREHGWAAAIKSTAEHLEMLTSLIVDSARAEAKGLILRQTRFDPRQLAQALGVALAARCRAKDLASEIEIAADLPVAVIGDPLRLRAALENLIDNAVKFTEHGSVRLEVGWAKAPRGRVRLAFAVTDSGIGLATIEIKRLFRPFAQANAQIAGRFGGAGLGLASIKRIARAMDGDLTVASKAGHGSTFRLTVTLLLASESDSTSADATTPAYGAVPPRPLNILCAEDNPYGRIVLNTMLAELGHRADFVGSGEAAVEAAKAGSYDAVLMDVMLSGLDGIEATRRIRTLPGRRLPIIGVSGRSSSDEEAHARAAGMDDYLAKPVGPITLARALAPIAARR
jgi:CheY-like chemotaxis protein/nitrogen-specific signal transduction histidine kinase